MSLRARLAELLKGLGIDIEGKLISFAARRRGGLNVKQKGEFNLVLVHPDAVDVLLREGKPSDLVAGQPKELRGLTRNDLAGEDAITFQATHDGTLLIKSMSRILSLDDLSALTSAIKIRRLEENGQAAAALERRLELKRRYKVRGNRIAVFYWTGMLQEFMGPILAMMEFTPTITDINRAKDIFDRCIDYMDFAVYANNLYTEERVAAELLTRFEIDNANVVLVFGLGRRVVATVERGVAKFMEPEHERQVSPAKYSAETERFEIGTKPGIVVTLSRATATPPGAKLPREGPD